MVSLTGWGRIKKKRQIIHESGKICNVNIINFEIIFIGALFPPGTALRHRLVGEDTWKNKNRKS
jgi:hypothetical protein